VSWKWYSWRFDIASRVGGTRDGEHECGGVSINRDGEWKKTTAPSIDVSATLTRVEIDEKGSKAARDDEDVSGKRPNPRGTLNQV